VRLGRAVSREELASEQAAATDAAKRPPATATAANVQWKFLCIEGFISNQYIIKLCPREQNSAVTFTSTGTGIHWHTGMGLNVDEKPIPAHLMHSVVKETYFTTNFKAQGHFYSSYRSC